MLKTKNYRDSLILKYNVDSQGNPVSIKIDNEKSQVSPINYTIHLMQIPDETYRMTILAPSGAMMYEVFDVETLGADNYKVDYAHGIVYFNPAHAGKTVTVSYYGRGVEMIHASRVLLGGDIAGEKLSDKLEAFLKAFEQLAKFESLLDQLKKEYEDIMKIVYADQPLLNLQQQIALLKAENKDHMRWRLNGNRAVAVDDKTLYNTQNDELIKVNN